MAIFSKIAKYYDVSIVNGRFNHHDIVVRLLPFITKPPIHVADLASGTGAMANAIQLQWPNAKIICEEPSFSMIKLLKKKYSSFIVNCNTLEETKIAKQDLVTIAFNSINYVKPDLLPLVFTRIKSGLNNDGILYFDALTKESAIKILQDNSFLEKTRKSGKLKVYSRLTLDTLFHIFSVNSGKFEEHTQYLVSETKYRELLIQAGFIVLNVLPQAGTMRTEFICKSAGKHINKTQNE